MESMPILCPTRTSKQRFQPGLVLVQSSLVRPGLVPARSMPARPIIFSYIYPCYPSPHYLSYCSQHYWGVFCLSCPSSLVLSKWRLRDNWLWYFISSWEGVGEEVGVVRGGGVRQKWVRPVEIRWLSLPIGLRFNTNRYSACVICFLSYLKWTMFSHQNDNVTVKTYFFVSFSLWWT